MRRLLVIEDDPDSLEMLSLLLEAGGYAVTSMLASDVAIRSLERETFDLVLADLLLESRQLGESWKRIDALVNLARPAQVGLITGWSVTPAEAEEHGVAFVIRKPCPREVLFDHLANALSLPELPRTRVNVMRTYFKAIEEHRFDLLASLCTDDVVYRLPGADPQFSKEIRGKNEFVPFAAKTFEAFPDTHFEVTSMRPLPVGALVEYAGSWKDGGETRHMPGAVMFEFRDQAISRIQVRVATEELR